MQHIASWLSGALLDDYSGVMLKNIYINLEYMRIFSLYIVEE